MNVCIYKCVCKCVCMCKRMVGHYYVYLYGYMYACILYICVCSGFSLCGATFTSIKYMGVYVCEFMNVYLFVLDCYHLYYVHHHIHYYYHQYQYVNINIITIITFVTIITITIIIIIQLLLLPSIIVILKFTTLLSGKSTWIPTLEYTVHFWGLPIVTETSVEPKNSWVRAR